MLLQKKGKNNKMFLIFTKIVLQLVSFYKKKIYFNSFYIYLIKKDH